MMNQTFIDFSKRQFYNTIKLSGASLNKREVNANGQNVRILAFFAVNPDSTFTPFEVQKHSKNIGANWPITSVRRAITYLTKDEKLIKTKQQRPGDYGELNYAWKLKAIDSSFS